MALDQRRGLRVCDLASAAPEGDNDGDDGGLKSCIVREGDDLLHSARRFQRDAMPASSSIAADRTHAKGQVLTTLDAQYKRSRASEDAGRAAGPALADAPRLDRTTTRWTS